MHLAEKGILSLCCLECTCFFWGAVAVQQGFQGPTNPGPQAEAEAEEAEAPPAEEEKKAGS